jgi:hypothetical protein
VLTVRGLTELQAAAVAFKECEAPIRKALQKEARTWAPTLVAAAAANARGQVQQQEIAASGRTTITNKGPTAVFGSTGRAGRTPLAKLARAYEFGTDDRQRKTEYLSRHRTSKRAMHVKRRTMAQLPARNPDGHFIHRAVAEKTPDLVARYVRAIAEVMNRA